MLELTQKEADALHAMYKYFNSVAAARFPMLGESKQLKLSSQGKEEFILDMSRGNLDPSKIKLQNRARKIVVLVRVDLGGPPHRNPDGKEVQTPHIHLYREGYGDKWAFPLRKQDFSNVKDLSHVWDDFLKYCNIEPLKITIGLYQ